MVDPVTCRHARQERSYTRVRVSGAVSRKKGRGDCGLSSQHCAELTKPSAPQSRSRPRFLSLSLSRSTGCCVCHVGRPMGRHDTDRGGARVRVTSGPRWAVAHHTANRTSHAPVLRTPRVTWPLASSCEIVARPVTSSCEMAVGRRKSSVGGWEQLASCTMLMGLGKLCTCVGRASGLGGGTMLMGWGSSAPVVVRDRGGWGGHAGAVYVCDAVIQGSRACPKP